MTGPILPFYLLIDQSGSMQGWPIEAVNASLATFLDTARSHPEIADYIRFEIIGFSSDASVVLPLSDLSTVSRIPPLQASGATSYGAAFQLLRQEIELAVRTLRRQAITVFRPTVFFMTDGSPTDHWEPAYSELIQSRQRPNIIAFGIGEANSQILSIIATHGAFKVSSLTRVDVAIDEFVRTMGESITRSSASVSTGPVAVTPRSVPGFQRVQPTANA
jgi:uncharacterized protein YegL